MKTTKQTYFTIELHEIEAAKLLMLLDELPSSALPRWAKDTAEKVETSLIDAGARKD